MTKPRHTRLTTLDLLRGFFLFIIIVDHVELFPSLFDLLSGKGRLWVSAAEGFFFISGLLVGYIYRRKLAEGLRYIIIKSWKRAGILYAWACLLTLGFTAWGVVLGGQFVKYGLPTSINWPDIVLQTLTLRYSYGWADFLSHYVVFMLAAPLVIYLLSKNKWWLVVVGSALLWLARGQSFKMAWQVIFVGGIIAGFYWRPLLAWIEGWSPRRRRTVRTSIMWSAGFTFALSYAGVYILGGLNDRLLTLPDWLQAITNAWNGWYVHVWHFFEKWTLEPGRIILFALWFIALYIIVEAHGGRLHRGIRAWLTMLGTNSLFVYGAHSLVAFMVHIWFAYPLSLWENCMITAAALAAVTGMTWIKLAIEQEPSTIHVRAKRRLQRMISSVDTPTS